MKTVNEVSKLSGVSVRTLHHYDAIGLLKPTAITNAGYRLYDDNAISKLENILLFRELQFPLKQIKAILENPDFDQKAVLQEQITLLQLQKKRVEKLIILAREMIKEEGVIMDFSAFDKSELAQYAKEARMRWEHTNAYHENETRRANRTETDEKEIADGLMRIFAEFGKIKGTDSSHSVQTQALVVKLQLYITENYYNCTPRILRGLGEMYLADERFRKSIDQAGGAGTAVFVSEAIANFTA